MRETCITLNVKVKKARYLLCQDENHALVFSYG